MPLLTAACAAPVARGPPLGLLGVSATVDEPTLTEVVGQTLSPSHSATLTPRHLPIRVGNAFSVLRYHGPGLPRRCKHKRRTLFPNST